MFSDMKTDANNTRELRREKAHFALPYITRVLFSFDLVFLTSLLSEGLARARRQIGINTPVKRTLHTSSNLVNYVRNTYNILKIRLSQYLAQLHRASRMIKGKQANR